MGGSFFLPHAGRPLKLAGGVGGCGRVRADRSFMNHAKGGGNVWFSRCLLLWVLGVFDVFVVIVESVLCECMLFLCLFIFLTFSMLIKSEYRGVAVMP